MRISRLSIDGFGIFRDVDLQEISSGLSIFLGNNEAGKSTTLGFVHTVLFGYPDGRTRERAYPPLRGGAPGGRIALHTESDGALTLERRDGKKGGPVTVTYPDGRSDGQPVLTRLLGGTTRHLYRNLYAFSLSELQDLETLTDTEVKDVIYGASLGASARSLPEARRRLETRMEELFRSGGSKPEINTRLRDLEDVRDQLRIAGQGIREYEELAGELSDLDHLIGEQRTRLATARETHERLKSYVALWDDWMDLQAAEERLAALPTVVEVFPEKGLSRLDELERQVETEGQELRGAEEDLGEKRKKLARLVFDEILLAKEAEVQVVARSLVGFEKATGEIPRAEEQLKSARRQTEQVLAEFGAGWTEERVLRLDRSAMIHRQIEEHRDALDTSQRRLEKAKHDEDELRAIRDEAAKEDKAARERVTKLRADRIEVAPATLSALREKREQFSSTVRDIPKVGLRHTEAVGDLQSLLREINSTWTPETLEEFDGSLTARQKVNEIDVRRSEADAQERDARGNADRAHEAVSEAEQAVARKTQAIAKAGAGSDPLEVLRKRKGVIRSLRNALSRRATAQAELRARRDAVEAQRSSQSAGTQRALRRTLTILAAVAAALALVVGPALWRTVDPEAGGIVGGILLLVAIVFFVVGRSASGSSTGQDAPAVAEDDVAMSELQASLNAVATAIAELQAQLGSSGEVNAADVDRLEDENDEQLRAAEDLVRLRGELEEFERAHERADTRKKTALAEIERAKVQRDDAEAAWRTLADTLQLPPDTAPRTAGLVFEKAETARGQARQIADLTARMSDMQAARTEYLTLMEGIPRLESVARQGTDEQRLTAVAEFLADMDRDEESARILTDAHLAAEGAARELVKATRKLEEAATEHREAAEAYEIARNAWSAWVQEHHMEDTWSPDTCLRLLDRATRLAELSGTRNEVAENVERLSREKETFRGKVAALCSDLDRAEPPEDKLAAEVYALEASLKKNSSQRTLNESLAADIPELSSRCDTRRKHLDDLRSKIHELVASGGAENAEEFHRRGQLFADRQDALQAIENRSGSIKKLSGQVDLDALREALANTNLPTLRAALADADTRVNETAKDLEDSQGKRVRTDVRRKQLHDEDAIARLRADEESLLEKLRERAADWGRHAVALHLLSTAKERFEKAHQPEVIRQASGYFASMTGGRYTQLFVPHDGDEDIEVIDAQGSRKSVKDLSRGTSEQLYLAIRFGYIASHRGGSERLPILMDDVLVNFDPERASQAAEGILEMARSHQVLFFTCHPETVEIFRRHREKVPVYRIENDDITGPVPLPPPARRSAPSPPLLPPGQASSGA